MAETGTMSVVGTGENQVYSYTHTTSASGDYKFQFQTGNKFNDHDIAVTITTPAAGAATLAITDLTSSLNMGTASSGKYSPTVSLSGTFTPSTAGWVSGAQNVSDNSVKVGTVNQSTLKNGTSTINSGSTVNPTASAQTINISEGYNAARTLIVGPVSSGPKGTVTSGTASLGGLTYTYNTSNNNFDISGTATIAAPTVNTAGYVSNSSDAAVGGTKVGNSNTVEQTVAEVTVGAELDGTFTKITPVIIRTAKPTSDSWIDAASGAEVTSTTTNTPYVRVDVNAEDATIKTKGKVTVAGYGTTSHYKTATSLSTDVGTNSAVTKFIPIKIGTITSPNTTATLGNPTYQSSGTNSGKFTIAASGTIATPTIDSEGYISSVVGTKNTGTISGTKVLNKVKVGVTVSGTTTVQPTISKQDPESGDGWTDAASGAATTSKPSTGAYVKVKTNAPTTTITSVGKVTSAGYGTTTSGQYATDTATETIVTATASDDTYIPITNATDFTLTVANTSGISGSGDVAVSGLSNGKYTVKASNLKVTATLAASTPGWFSSQSSTDSDVDSCTVGKIAAAGFTTSGGVVYCSKAGYVPLGSASSPIGTISNATFANTATADITYTDISNDAPVLISGDFLYINAGYISNSKISLSKLVPDDATIPVVSGHSVWIHPSYSAYDNEGNLIAGSMAIYDGSYTVT